MTTSLLKLLHPTHTLRGILTAPDAGTTKTVVLCLGGFERSATTEKKFKRLADALAQRDVATLRLDYTGLGLSDGDFRETTMTTLVADAKLALQTLHTMFPSINVIIAAHSLGACVALMLKQQSKIPVQHMIFFAPALHQSALLRYWFVQNVMKQREPNTLITWDNYQNYLVEEDFLADCARDDRQTKSNVLGAAYMLFEKDQDYTPLVANNDILHIHGTKDTVVPPESISATFLRTILVPGANHDMERPHDLKQWLEQATEYASAS